MSDEKTRGDIHTKCLTDHQERIGGAPRRSGRSERKERDGRWWRDDQRRREGQALRRLSHRSATANGKETGSDGNLGTGKACCPGRAIQGRITEKSIIGLTETSLRREDIEARQAPRAGTLFGSWN